MFTINCNPMLTKRYRWRAILGGVLAGILVDLLFVNSLNALLVSVLASETFTGHPPDRLLVAVYVPVRIVLSLLPLAVSCIVTSLIE